MNPLPRNAVITIKALKCIMLNFAEHRNHMKALRLLILIPLFGLLNGCGTTTPTYDTKAIQSENDPKALQTLFQTIQTSYQQEKNKGKAATDLKKSLDQVGAKLAVHHIKLNKTQSESLRVGNLLPLGELEKHQKLMKSLRMWSVYQAQLHQAWLDDEQARTTSAVTEIKEQINALPELRIREKQNLLKELTMLGDQDAQNLLDQNQEMYAQAVIQQARINIENHRYPEASDLIQSALSVVQDHPELTHLQRQVEAEIKTNLFEQALENGDPDQAISILDQLSQQNALEWNQERLIPQIKALSDYYASLGRNATQSKQYYEAYQQFQLARSVLQKVKLPVTTSSDEQSFLKSLQSLSIRASQEGLPGLEMAYLQILQNMDPQFPGIENSLRKPREQTLENSVKRVNIGSFKDQQNQSSYGHALSARVTQLLFEQIPNDIRIVERDELESIIRERSLNKNSALNKLSIHAADLLVQGSVLEASVEHADKEGFTTERVQTGLKKTANPEYAAWQESRKKNKTVAPDEFLEEPIMEDIRYSVTQHRKIALFSASYRLVDANSAKMIHTNSLTQEQQATGNSSEGVALGDYQKPLKLADLPSDGEMLKTLMNKLAIQISDELAQALAETEKELLVQSVSLSETGNYAEAAEYAARAYMITANKGLDTQDVYEKMVSFALQSGL